MENRGARSGARERRQREAEEARLRDAGWPQHDTPSRASYGAPPRDPPPARSWDDSDEIVRSMPPTRRLSSRAWDRRAGQIDATHDAWYAPYEHPRRSAPPLAPTGPLPSVPRYRRTRRGVRGWMRRRWRSGPLGRAIIVASLVAMIFVACAPATFLARGASAALDGYHRLIAAQDLLTSDGLTALTSDSDRASLQQDLVVAHADFSQVQQTLDATGPLENAPPLDNMARLTRMAVDLTGAGETLLAVAGPALTPILANPFGKSDAPLSAATLAQATAGLQQADRQMSEAAALAPTITTAGLPASLAQKLPSLLEKIAQAAQVVHLFAGVIGDAPALLGLGAPATYLLLAMDRTELRTGGGFIGNYGLVTIGDARLQSATLHDTYTLDAAYFARTGQEPPATYPWWPYHGASAIYGWGVRDSNLAPDFPTNAANALQIYDTVQSNLAIGTGHPVAGVIGITSVVMAQIIAASGGSLRLPEYPTHVITPQNLDDTIHCFQLGACGDEQPILQKTDPPSTDRKRFTAFLGQALIDRVRHLPTDQIKTFMKLILQDVGSKDVQIFVTKPSAETALLHANLGAGMATGTVDTLFVTDTNIGGNKANSYVTQSEEDLVTLLPDGSALHRLVIHTVYQRQGPLYEGLTGQTSYWDYRRVYLPATARLLGTAGFAGGADPHALNFTTTSDTAGHSMAGAALTLGDGSATGACQPMPGAPSELWKCAPQPRDIYIYWIVPHAWSMVNDHLSYALTVQRQAGSTVTLRVLVDTHLVHGAMPALSTATIVRSYDTPSDLSPTGYSGQPGPAWTALGEHAGHHLQRAACPG